VGQARKNGHGDERKGGRNIANFRALHSGSTYGPRNISLRGNSGGEGSFTQPQLNKQEGKKKKIMRCSPFPKKKGAWISLQKMKEREKHRAVSRGGGKQEKNGDCLGQAETGSGRALS